MTQSSSPTRRLPQPGSQKIGSRHLDRLALVYVRQSTVQQVLRHQESTRLQYGLVERATAMGWPRPRVMVIDEDQGRSGASAAGRPGFQKLVAEVGLDHVGIVLGIEMSRLARSCRDWHQLLEICAVFGTLIGDADGIYDPTNFNDRLLLGLKGTMSEAELHVIQQRMSQGRLAKARRGQLSIQLPMGYVRRPSGEVVKDPDEQAQSTVELVFETFERKRTLSGVLRYLVEHEIQLPVRLRSGPAKGELSWRRPNRMTLQNLLRNPTYAGAYAYGRRRVDPRRKLPGRPSTGRVVVARDEWEVLLQDQHPPYISWAQYERNTAQLEANRTTGLGVARQGHTLLPGLLICGHCGLRMTVRYQRDGGPRYVCHRMAVDYAAPICQSLRGDAVDALIGDLVLQALEPSALDVSLQAASDIEAERGRLRQHWSQRLERARQTTERAYRQYNAVEPENRLVARTLERQWEEALAAQELLEADHARMLTEQPRSLTPVEVEAIRQLAEDIPALWHAPTTTPVDRQTIVRSLVDRILLTVHGQTEKVDVEVHWAGGHKTAASTVRPVARLDQLSYFPQLLHRAVSLREQGMRHTDIATQLNTEGWRPPKRRRTFNAAMVGQLLRRAAPDPTTVPDADATDASGPADDWSITKLARELNMPSITLYSWVRRGWVDAHRDDQESRTPWRIRADADEVARLRALRSRPRGWSRLIDTREVE